MTGPARPNPPIETRLDELLDHLVAGDELPATDDGELQGLGVVARAIRDDDRIEWPESGFPERLTANVHAELQPVNGRITAGGDQVVELWTEPADDAPRRLTTSIPASDVAELTGETSRTSRLRRFAQIAAAVVGFGLLTLVLVAIFRGFDDEQPSAIGTGDDEGRPPQLAVTMQTDPVNGNPDIFLVTLDGSDPVNLTDHPAVDTMPAWSPNGSKIAFISDRNGASGLYVIDADGGNVRSVYTPDPGEDWHLQNPAWSPDGSTVAVMRFSLAPDSNDADVLILDAGGNGMRIVSMHPDYPGLAIGQTLEWSPDGNWLAFEVHNDEVHRVAVASMNSYLTQPLGFGSAPSWSRSGEIVFSNERDVTIATFVDDPLALDEVTEFTLPVAQAISQPELSADGSRLVFIASTAGGSSIWISRSDGSDQVEVPDSGFSAYPVWSPDGGQLAFLRFGAFFSADSTGYDLMVYDIESETLTTVLDTGFDGPLMGPPAWRPASAGDEPRTEVTPTAPPETPTATENVDEILTPPIARLHAGNGSIEAVFGSYSWQFSDPDQTFASVEAPIIPLTGGSLPVEPGEPLAVSIRGDEFTRPPETTTIEVYSLAENQALQTGPAGRPDTESIFTILTDPVLTIEPEDRAGPSFTLDLLPDRYAIVVRSDWGAHPNLDRDIFVTWVFDVQIVESTSSSDVPDVEPIPYESELRVGSKVIEGTLGSYTWQFGDADSSLRSTVYRHLPDPVEAESIRSNATIQVTVREGEAVDPPQSTTVDVYPVDLEPVDPSDQSNPDPNVSTLRITMLDEPLTTFAIENPAAPEFTLDVPPGNYALFVRSSWGQHPTFDREIFVTWVFDVEVTETEASADFQDDPRVQQAIDQVREFLGDPNAELTVDSINEANGQTRIHLSRPVPGLDNSEESRDSFVLYPGYETSIAAFLVSNTAVAQPENPVDEEQARTIAENFYDRHDIFDVSLTPIDAPRIVSVEMDDEFYNYIWQLQREDVWLPTIVQVVVSADTGLVAGYTRIDFQYEGPLTPAIGESEASQIALDLIAEDPELAGVTIEETRLTVPLVEFGNAVEDNHAALDMETRLRLAWEFTLTARPGPASEHVVWIDAMTGERLTTSS